MEARPSQRYNDRIDNGVGGHCLGLKEANKAEQTDTILPIPFFVTE